MVIGLSHSGTNIYTSTAPAAEVLVGTKDGVALLARDAAGWKVAHRALNGRHVSSIVIEPDSGTVFAGAFHDGSLHASTDGGRTWEERSNGIGPATVFSMAHARYDGRTRIFAGTEPARLFYSDDLGLNWTEFNTLRDVETVDAWSFPAPPHVAHLKFISFDPHNTNTVYACVEQGALLKSTDAGGSWREINSMGSYTDAGRPTTQFYDVHKVLIDPRNTDRLLVTGGAGLYVTEDGGGHWDRHMAPGWAPDVYPDALVMHPKDPDLIFIGAAEHNPATWRESHFAGGKVFRSTDGAKTFEQLKGGWPERLQQEIGALCLEDWGDGFSLFAATTGGEVYSSDDGGDSWSLIAEGITPVSKGGHYVMLQPAGVA